MQTSNRNDFIASISELAKSVYDFHERFSVPPIDATANTEASLSKIVERIPFLVEEIGEHAKAVNHGDLMESLMELADVAYVVLGTLLIMDEAGKDALSQVAYKNNQKTNSTHVRMDSSGKIVKRSKQYDIS